MKIMSSIPPAGFTPFTLSISVQSEDDAARLYAILSHPGVAAVIAGAGGEDEFLDGAARNLLTEQVPNIGRLSSMYVAALNAPRS